MQEILCQKETSVHIICECPVLEKERTEVLDWVQMDPGQMNEVRLGDSGLRQKGRNAK